MSEACENNCSSCQENCASRQPSKEELLVPQNMYSKIKRVIGVVSGKGGVGKSFVTSSMAVQMQRKGYRTAILDADITGPSIPKAFGVHTKAVANEMGIIPGCSKNGTKIMSVNLLLDEEEIPVVWRGPIIAGTVKQFWSDVIWDKVDYMFVDMPPGTGDVPLTVFQSLPLDGIIIVTSPQELVSMIVGKAVNMAKAMDIPILGIIENYSYVSCGNCGEKISVFGQSHIEEVAKKYNLKILAKLPLDANVANAVDRGEIEELQVDWFEETVNFIEQVCPCEDHSGIQGLRKVAITTDDNHTVFQHFGHCKKFTIYTIEDGKLIEEEILETEGKGHVEVADAMIKADINALICGGIGSSAMEQLMSAGITVVPGQQGDINVVTAAFLDGSLSSSNIPTCAEHESHESCGTCGGCSGCQG